TRCASQVSLFPKDYPTQDGQDRISKGQNLTDLPLLDQSQFEHQLPTLGLISLTIYHTLKMTSHGNRRLYRNDMCSLFSADPLSAVSYLLCARWHVDIDPLPKRLGNRNP